MLTALDGALEKVDLATLCSTVVNYLDMLTAAGSGANGGGDFRPNPNDPLKVHLANCSPLCDDGDDDDDGDGEPEAAAANSELDRFEESFPDDILVAHVLHVHHHLQQQTTNNQQLF